MVTSLTMKTYPMQKVACITCADALAIRSQANVPQFLTGRIVMESSEASIRAVSAAAKTFEPTPVVLQHIVMLDMVGQKNRDLIASSSWYGDDVKQGNELLDNYVKAVSPVKVNMVKESTAADFLAQKYPPLPFGSVRSACVTQIDGEVVEKFVDAMKTMPKWGNMTWTDGYKLDHDKMPKNCFGPGNHAFVTFSDIAPIAESHEESKEWADGFDKTLKEAKSFTAQSYPPLTRPGTRTAKEMLGDKYERAIELKRKYDPENVFKHAIPRLMEE